MANSDSIIRSFPDLDASNALHNLSLDSETKSGNDNKLQGPYSGKDNEFLLEATKNVKPSLLSKDGDLTKDKRSNPKKLGYQNSACNPKGGSYWKGAYSYGFYSPAYQYQRYGYSGSYASGKTNLPYPYLHHGRSAGVGQSFGYMDNIYSSYGMCGPYMNGSGAGYGYGSYGYDAWKHMPNWYAVNNCYKTRNGFNGYGKENIEGMNELNRGPRAKGFKGQEGSKVVTETEKTREDVSLPDLTDYNKKDFPETYTHARFFVIKSYSEDDIHKSIKYSVWSSTRNGNKKLDASYNEANQKPDGCPVFLLFSVNTSGQFVGLAEMVGPVDFNKTLEYWQQDKWIGCFPVKWHIIKDIPNSCLRHITLENNENKPVTNSRDTQEVKLEQGIKVINIFKDHASKTCILDDFEFYETRQNIIQEGKSKQPEYKKQALVANGDEGNKSVIAKHNPVLSTRASEDAAAQVSSESKAVNGVASAC